MIDFITVALKNVFSKPATRNYPTVKRNAFEKQRGQIKINVNDCIFCGMCMRKCPAGAIKVDRAEKKWTIDRFSCIVCSYCAESCPKKCLSVDPDYTKPAFTKTSDTFEQKREETEKDISGKENA
jgi:formate hydrogenlyase subunit 6/NADH:ubiquinone oxidoreductase subunit I